MSNFTIQDIFQKYGEDYIEKIANGIYNAIISSYETYLNEEH